MNRPTIDDLPDVMSVRDACNLLGISKSKMYELCNTNVCPNRKIGSRILILKNEFLHWLEIGDVV